MWVQAPGQENPWNRKWQPTPVFLPGKFHGQRSLAGYSPWGCKESDTTEHSTHTVVITQGSGLQNLFTQKIIKRSLEKKLNRLLYQCPCYFYHLILIFNTVQRFSCTYIYIFFFKFFTLYKLLQNIEISVLYNRSLMAICFVNSAYLC